MELELLKRIMQKVQYLCGASLSEYNGPGNDRDEEMLKLIFVRENISCSSKIELPYYSVEHFPRVCIYCGIIGTLRTLKSSDEHYPQCNSCSDKPNVVRRKRKNLTKGDFLKAKKKK